MQEEKSFISQALSSALMIRPVFLCVSFPLIAWSAVLAQDETSLNRGAYGSVMTPEQVMRELGPGTGLLPGDQAYEGRPVKSVSVRYRSTGKTVSEDRLKNLLATQPGTSYSPEVVNKDLERLLESGLVGGNTTVAVEPSGDGVAVVFEMAAQNLLAWGSAAIPRSTTGTSPRNAG
jgi:outer membrane protein insertion porin family